MLQLALVALAPHQPLRMLPVLALPPHRHQLRVLVQATRLIKQILIHLRLKKAEKTRRTKRLVSNNFTYFFLPLLEQCEYPDVYYINVFLQLLINSHFSIQVGDVKDSKEDPKGSKEDDEASSEKDKEKEDVKKEEKDAETETTEKEKDKTDIKDEKVTAKQKDDKAESSESKLKSEPEEDVVIVKDDEEEVEKREVFNGAKSYIYFVRQKLDLHYILSFRKRIIKKKM